MHPVPVHMDAYATWHMLGLLRDGYETVMTW